MSNLCRVITISSTGGCKPLSTSSRHAWLCLCLFFHTIYSVDHVKPINNQVLHLPVQSLFTTPWTPSGSLPLDPLRVSTSGPRHLGSITYLDKMVGMKSMFSSPFVSSHLPKIELAAANTEHLVLSVVVIPGVTMLLIICYYGNHLSNVLMLLWLQCY